MTDFSVSLVAKVGDLNRMTTNQLRAECAKDTPGSCSQISRGELLHGLLDSLVHRELMRQSDVTRIDEYQIGETIEDYRNERFVYINTGVFNLQMAFVTGMSALVTDEPELRLSPAWAQVVAYAEQHVQKVGLAYLNTIINTDETRKHVALMLEHTTPHVVFTWAVQRLAKVELQPTRTSRFGAFGEYFKTHTSNDAEFYPKINDLARNQLPLNFRLAMNVWIAQYEEFETGALKKVFSGRPLAEIDFKDFLDDDEEVVVEERRHKKSKK
jgi:hypothetical protein